VPDASPVLARTRFGVLYVRWAGEFGCLFATGREVHLKLNEIGGSVKPIKLARAFLASPYLSCDEGQYCHSGFAVSDLRDGRIVHSVETGNEIEGTSQGAVKIVLKPNGSVAWTGCAGYDTCGRPFTVNRLDRTAEGSGTTVELDRGRNIEPRSLRRVGDTLLWEHGGKTRSAPFG